MTENARVPITREHAAYGSRFPFQIELGGRPIAEVKMGRCVELALPPGPCCLTVTVGRGRHARSSKPLQLELEKGRCARLVCGARPVSTNPLHRHIELKVLLLFAVIGPLAVAASLSPRISAFLERHLQMEILLTFVAFILGFAWIVPGMIKRLGSNEPGAMLYLAIQTDGATATVGAH